MRPLRGLMDQASSTPPMFNSLTPAMFAREVPPARPIRELIEELVCPTRHSCSTRATALCDRASGAVRAFLAAFRETIEILQGRRRLGRPRQRMKLDEGQRCPFRDAARKDLMGKFEPTTETDIRKVFSSCSRRQARVIGLTRYRRIS